MANYNDRGGRRSDDYKRPNRKNSDGSRYSDDRKPRFNDDRKPRFDSDRKPRFDGDRKPRFDGDRKPRFDGDRKPRFNDDRKPRFDGDRKPRFDSDRKPRFNDDRKPRFDSDRKPHFDGDRKPRFDGDRKPRFDGDRKPRFDGDRKPRFNDDRKPRFDGDRKPRFNDDRKPRFDGDRKPRFDGDRKPCFDGDRKPRFDSDRKPRFDSGRKPFESDFFEDEVLDVEFNAFPSPEIVENDEQERDLPSIIMGRNPVKEAIKSGRSIDRILVTKEHDGSLGEIIGLARDENLVIREVDRSKLDEICMPFGHNGKPGNHQGIVAEIPGVEYAELEDILDYARVRDEKPFVILLDGVEDPHNLGSIIRSAECAGAHGVVITKRRSAPVTATVVKTSAGAAEHMRIARVVNLVSAIETLKKEGLWIAGADMAGNSMYEADMKGGFALVIGSEGSGLSKLVKEKCDFLVSVPIKGKIDSLNASVAAAIIMFEKNRQDSVN